MGWKYNRKHLHASVGAATLYGGGVGWWIGARVGSAAWYESMAFTLIIIVAPAIIFSRIDKKYLQPEE